MYGVSSLFRRRVMAVFEIDPSLFLSSCWLNLSFIAFAYIAHVLVSGSYSANIN
jgi:hypothetical protein